MLFHTALPYLTQSCCLTQGDLLRKQGHREQMLLGEGVLVPLFTPFSLSHHSLPSDLGGPCYCPGLDKMSEPRLVGFFCTEEGFTGSAARGPLLLCMCA